MIVVKEVSNKRESHIFHTFSISLYKHVPQYVPTLIFDEKWNFNPKKNPAYEYVETICFLAYKDGKVAGRIAGLINHKLNDLKQIKTLRFHRWDVIDDLEVSRALFDAVIDWGKKKGMDRIIGPIGFSDLDKQGLLIEGFEETSMFITLYNHPYYHTHLTELGFDKEVDWIEYQIKVPEQPDPRIERLCDIAKKRNGYRLLEFSSKKQVIPYAREMFHMYNDSFAELYGFCPLTDGQIDMAIKQFISLVSLDYIYVVVDKQEQVVGFGIMAPSLSQAMKKSRGRLLPLGWYHILKSSAHHSVLDMYLIAVKPEFFGRGVNAIILNEGVKKAIENNVAFAETGPELENNTQVQTQWKSFDVRQHKRRRCYAKSI